MAKYHFIKHFNLVNKHRWLVFLNCCHLGIPFQGLVHDLSKYTPTEFIKSAKYYLGDMSPIMEERKENNLYSDICVHHINRNKHHLEYWVDFCKGSLVTKPMPYKYALEYVADTISASKVYAKKNFTRDYPLNYFLERKERYTIHEATKSFIVECLTIYKNVGFSGLNKKTTKSIYKNCLERFPGNETFPIDFKNKTLVSN